jgi:hypothetical protein
MKEKIIKLKKGSSMDRYIQKTDMRSIAEKFLDRHIDGLFDNKTDKLKKDVRIIFRIEVKE